MEEVASSVFHIPLMPRNGINCYLVDDVLIDAGIRSSYSKILKAVKGRPVRAHALTHAHADHQGSSGHICEALKIPLWVSELERQNAESGQVTSEYPQPKHPISVFQKSCWAGPGFKVSRLLKEGDTVGSFTVIETPGHAKGHISFFRERDGVLIVGDALVNMNLLTTKVGLALPPALFTTDQQRNIRSVKKLLALKPQIMCFGHGPVLTDLNLWQHFEKSL